MVIFGRRGAPYKVDTLYGYRGEFLPPFVQSSLVGCLVLPFAFEECCHFFWMCWICLLVETFYSPQNRSTLIRRKMNRTCPEEFKKYEYVMTFVRPDCENMITLERINSQGWNLPGVISIFKIIVTVALMASILFPFLFFLVFSFCVEQFKFAIGTHLWGASNSTPELFATSCGVWNVLQEQTGSIFTGFKNAFAVDNRWEVFGSTN